MKITQSGSFRNIERFLKAMENNDRYLRLSSLAQQGVDALAAATPKRSGVTAQSWSYEIETQGSEVTITWTNDHVNGNEVIAILLQYGHGTGTGGYVAGQDYINPAIKPIFDEIGDAVWKEVKNA